MVNITPNLVASSLIQITKEKKANRLKVSVENPIFTLEQDHLRWSKFITLGYPTQL